MKIELNGTEASLAENTRWRGMGMVSGNNSSRLLMDYKVLNPQRYNELLNLMFGSNGIGIQHLKIEMGSDINSSSGTEPCTMRIAEEKADVTRGAGFMLCADAKKINPDITLDMLWWSEPLWIEESSDVYAARYSWYKGNLVEAFNTYGITFDFVSATQNERGWDSNWIKYLSNKLKNEKDAPYDFSKIKIVIGDEVCTWNQAQMMVEDSELLKAVDVIGSHYTSWSDENVAKLQKLGKEIWFSEGSSPMGFSSGVSKYDGNGSGLSGLNGVLDVANRIITMYPGGKMTLCEFQPVISSYYDGVCYCHKQFITANTPWNGYYELDPGFYMTLHFSQFIERGWAVLEKASFGDGKPAGDGHSIGDATYSFLSCCNPETGDWSTVITNTTKSPIQYELCVQNLSSENVYLYETTSCRIEDTLNKRKLDVKNGIITINIQPNSLVTISTLDKNPLENLPELPKENSVMPLPYYDDFSYLSYKSDFLSNRGNAPLFTTDEAGAFEVEKIDGKSFLVQQIYLKDKAKEWGWTPDPVTNLGDDRWFNYGAEISFKFDPESSDQNNYVGLGIRYNLPCEGQNGYWLKITQDGRWDFIRNKQSCKKGKLTKFTKSLPHTMYIGLEKDFITLKVDDQILLEISVFELGISMQGGGRVSIFSGYYKNQFANLSVIPLGNNPFIKRFDNFSDCFEYINGTNFKWKHSIMDSFKSYKRTSSTGKKGCKLKLNFYGSGINLCGSVEKKSSIKVWIDDSKTEEKIVNNIGNREVIYHLNNLSESNHTVEMEILSGEVKIDSVELN